MTRPTHPQEGPPRGEPPTEARSSTQPAAAALPIHPIQGTVAPAPGPAAGPASGSSPRVNPPPAQPPRKNAKPKDLATLLQRVRGGVDGSGGPRPFLGVVQRAVGQDDAEEAGLASSGVGGADEGRVAGSFAAGYEPVFQRQPELRLRPRDSGRGQDRRQNEARRGVASAPLSREVAPRGESSGRADGDGEGARPRGRGRVVQRTDTRSAEASASLDPGKDLGVVTDEVAVRGEELADLREVAVRPRDDGAAMK